MKTLEKAKYAKFTASKGEFASIQRIAKRACAMNPEYDKTTCLMDLEACHSSGNPMDFAALEQADDFNFAHDVFGIARHINRVTGELENFFSPRFSAK